MGVSIIIVDDDKAVRFFHGITVKEATKSTLEPLSFSNGKDVLAYLDENHHESDYYLMLLDINMPLMNGWELLKAITIKPYSKKIFFVMVTSSVDNADKEYGKLFSQVIDFVEKPIKIEDFKRIMKNYAMINMKQHQ